MRPFVMLRDLAAQLRTLTAESAKVQISAYRGHNNSVCDFEIFLLDYRLVVETSLKLWKNLTPSLALCRGRDFSVNALDKARSYLIASYSSSLSTKGNPYYTCTGVYRALEDKNCKPIPGCKWHQPDSTLHLEGVVWSRRLESPGLGNFPENSQDTLAKNWLRSQTLLARWHQFRLTPDQFKDVRAVKLTLSDCDMIRHYGTMAHCWPIEK